MTALASMTPEDFYAKAKKEQVTIVWKALFIDQTPLLSEATCGVITTLTSLGLTNEVAAQDLEAIRSFYDTYRESGVEGAERYLEFNMLS
jgi:hypothetical protein